ncbi:MAG: hypothetical protein PUD59_06850 [bacterium]|nr:hypothetical protein [bacterium]
MVKKFDSLDEIQKYYDEKTNTYIFKENGKYIDIVAFNFNLNVEANIDAKDIKAQSINAMDINASNISAWDIITKDINAENIDSYNINVWNLRANNIKSGNIEANNIYAHDISYWAVCFAIQNITCHSIKGRRENAKHFVLDGALEVLKQ